MESRSREEILTECQSFNDSYHELINKAEAKQPQPDFNSAFLTFVQFYIDVGRIYPQDFAYFHILSETFDEWLSKAYRIQDLSKETRDEAFELLKKANNDTPNNPSTQFALGLMYSYDAQTQKHRADDDKKAVALLSQAAEQKHALAECRLGALYEEKYKYNPSIREYRQKAIGLYRQAANHGHLPALIYLAGTAGDDKTRIIKLCRQALEQECKWVVPSKEHAGPISIPDIIVHTMYLSPKNKEDESTFIYHAAQALLLLQPEQKELFDRAKAAFNKLAQNNSDFFDQLVRHDPWCTNDRLQAMLDPQILNDYYARHKPAIKAALMSSAPLPADLVNIVADYSSTPYAISPSYMKAIATALQPLEKLAKSTIPAATLHGKTSAQISAYANTLLTRIQTQLSTQMPPELLSNIVNEEKAKLPNLPEALNPILNKLDQDFKDIADQYSSEHKIALRNNRR